MFGMYPYHFLHFYTPGHVEGNVSKKTGLEEEIAVLDFGYATQDRNGNAEALARGPIIEFSRHPAVLKETPNESDRQHPLPHSEGIQELRS